MDVKRGDILFYSENSAIASLVKRSTHGIYNHVEMCVFDNIAFEVRPKNVGLINLKYKETNLKEGEFIDVFRPHWKNKNEAVKRALEILKNTRGYSLGNITAFLTIAQLRKQDYKGYAGDDCIICSEVVGECLLSGGIHCKVEYDVSLMSPNDLLHDFNLPSKPVMTYKYNI